MTDQDAYMHGSSYEIFIRRAFKCERGKHGAENAYFKFLLLADIGKNFLSKPYEKEFDQVKEYLTKAIDKFLKRKPTDTERAFLEQMQEVVNHAGKASDLVQIIAIGLENTIRYKDL